jgi:hypothetical protein
MSVYHRSWGIVDSGREGLWKPEKWFSVIEVVSNHPDADYYDVESPLYEELRERMPDESWFGEKKERPIFRDYTSPWRLTETIEFKNQKVHLANFGMYLLKGIITREQLILRMMRGLKDNGGERPYQVIASAFLESQMRLDFDDIYYGVAQRYKPGTDDIFRALSLARSLESKETKNPYLERKLRHILSLLVEVGAILPIAGSSSDEVVWEPADNRVLRYITKERETDVRLETLTDEMAAAFQLAGLYYDQELLVCYVAALLAKRFVILTGLSGSGKTKLAQAFAHWIAGPGHYEIVAVGANWTSNEHILGYADALDPTRYVRTDALNLIVSARETPDMPHFLILDEMNLSHVEQYFADLLSSIESGAPVRLHNAVDEKGNSIDIQGIEASLGLPPNLFIIGTVNVDETTYMFSPKVLDRSNVIEFRVSRDDIEVYFNDSGSVDLERLTGSGVEYARVFLEASEESPDLDDDMKDRIKEEFMLMFDLLEEYGAEFGFRTVNEVIRFICFYLRLSNSAQSGWNPNAVDAQIMQKILPKLHGSRRQLEPLLSALAALCYFDHQWDDAKKVLANREDLLAKSREWADPFNNLALDLRYDRNNAYYPRSYHKIQRMLRMLVANGFASYAEA